MNILHHLTTGGVQVEFSIERELFFIPLIMLLKCFTKYSDHLIFRQLIKGREHDAYYSE